VWVADPVEAYVAGTVVSVNGDVVKVSLEAGTAVEVKENELHLVENADREDMVTLNYLHEPGVLHNLKNRYGLDEIYTYTGNILIASLSSKLTTSQNKKNVKTTGQPVPAPSPPVRPRHDGPVPRPRARRVVAARVRHCGNRVFRHD